MEDEKLNVVTIIVTKPSSIKNKFEKWDIGKSVSQINTKHEEEKQTSCRSIELNDHWKCASSLIWAIKKIWTNEILDGMWNLEKQGFTFILWWKVLSWLS